MSNLYKFIGLGVLLLGCGIPAPVFAQGISGAGAAGLAGAGTMSVAGSASVVSPASAAGPGIAVGTGAVSLAQLEQQALVNQPSIQAYEQKLCALNGYWQQAGLGLNPEIGYTGEEMSSAAPGGRQKIFVSQEIERGGQRYYAQGVVAEEIQAVQQELEIAKLRVLSDVRIAAYQYLSVQNKLAHLQQISKNDTTLAERIAVSAQNGNASKLDLVNSRIAARKSQQKYAEAQNELQAAWQRLACLLGTPEMKPRLVKAPLEQIPEVKTQEFYVRQILNSSPELARSQARIAQAQKKMEYENARNTSNITLSGGVAYNTEEDVMEGSVGVSMPLRIRNRNQGNIAAARSEVIQAQKDYDRVALDIQHRLADLYARYVNARENLELYQSSLLPDARSALELAQTSYEHAETGLLELVSAQKTYRETNIEYYDALCEYWTAYTILEGQLLYGSLQDSSL